MATTKKKPVKQKACTKNEAYDLIRDQLSKHNNDAHPEDCFCLNDWMDELIGETYGGWKIVKDPYNSFNTILEKQ